MVCPININNLKIAYSEFYQLKTHAGNVPAEVHNTFLIYSFQLFIYVSKRTQSLIISGSSYIGEIFTFVDSKIFPQFEFNRLEIQS